MGSGFPWLSSAGSDFNFDYRVSFIPARAAADLHMISVVLLLIGSKAPVFRLRLVVRNSRSLFTSLGRPRSVKRCKRRPKLERRRPAALLPLCP